MKLVTFDEGRVGRIDGDVVAELDCGSMRVRSALISLYENTLCALDGNPL